MAKASYRFVILSLLFSGVLFNFCLRHTFVVTVTHTARLHDTYIKLGVQGEAGSGNWSYGDGEGSQHFSEGGANIYKGCTVYNTSRDYVSNFGWSWSVMFYSVHFMGMSTAYVVSLYVSSRFRPYHAILCAYTTHAMITLSIPLLFKLSGLAVATIRFAAGFCEAVVQASAAQICSAWAFQGEETRFFTVAFLGIYVGPAVASLTAGACLCYVSWDAALYIFSGLLTVWCLLWRVLSYDSPLNCPRLSVSDICRYRKKEKHRDLGDGSKARKVPWRKIFASKPVWAIWVAFANKNTNMVASSTLMPLFFKDVYNIRAADSVLLLIAPHLTLTLCATALSAMSDRLINTGSLSTTSVRKLMQCGGAAGETIFILCVVYVTDWRLAMVCLTMAYGIGGACVAGYASNTMDLCPRYTGSVFALTSTSFVFVVIYMTVASQLPDHVMGVGKWAILLWFNAGTAAFSCVFYLLFASGDLQEWATDDLGDYEKALQSASDESVEETGEEDDSRWASR